MARQNFPHREDEIQLEGVLEYNYGIGERITKRKFWRLCWKVGDAPISDTDSFVSFDEEAVWSEMKNNR
jgi:hypothetical protein